MKKLKIAIVNYEQALGIDGILSKYSRMLERELLDMGYDAFVTDQPTKKADINHHVNFISYVPSGKKDTLMITHVSGDRNHSEEEKLAILKKGLKTAKGIAMSKSLMDYLIGKGFKKSDLSCSTHAHDEIERRPRFIALCYNLYPDGRKREQMFVDLFRSLKDKRAFIFRIIGNGWRGILEDLTKEDIQVQWQPTWNIELYKQLLNTSDYLLYTGDEDSLAQSVVDATQCALPVIAPPQKDLDVQYPFTSQKELNAIFDRMQENQVKDWTWEKYAKDHLKVWESL